MTKQSSEMDRHVRFQRTRDDNPKQPSRLSRCLGVARWISSLAALALAPKCLLCVAGYLGFATGLGLVGVELCGDTTDGAGMSLRNVAPALGVLGLSLCAALIGRRFFRTRSCTPVQNDAGRSLE